MTNEFMQLLQQYEGIFGVLIGFALAEMLKRIGNVKIYSGNTQRQYGVHDEYGSYYYVYDSDERYRKYEDNLKGTKIEVCMDVVNTFQENKTFRDIHAQCIFENGEKLSIVPFDESTRRVSGGMSISDKLTILNLQAKTTCEYKMSVYIPEEYTKVRLVKVYFIARRPNGTKIKKRIM